MSDYFDSSENRVTAASLARSTHVNTLRDDVGVGFDLLPDPDDLQQGTANVGVDSGEANAYVVAMDSSIIAYVDGLEVVFKPLITNTGASTITVNSIGPIAIKRQDGEDIEADDLPSGDYVSLRYNGTDFRRTSGFNESLITGYVSSASDSADAAATSETNAATSETNAANSASAAATSATESSDSADDSEEWALRAEAAAAEAGVLPDLTDNAGRVLAVNATETNVEWIPAAAGYEEFTSSGTFTKTDDATVVYVELIGSGAAGGSYVSNTSTTHYVKGGSGGDGKTRLFQSSELSSTVTVTIGAGAVAVAGNSGGDAGADGNESTFGGYMSAAGGCNPGSMSSSSTPNADDNFSRDPASPQKLSHEGGWTPTNYKAGNCNMGGAGGSYVSGNNTLDTTALIEDSGGVSDRHGDGGSGTYAGGGASPADIAYEAEDGVWPGGGGGACAVFAALNTGTGTAKAGDGADGGCRIWWW